MIFKNVLLDNKYVFRKAVVQNSSECLSTGALQCYYHFLQFFNEVQLHYLQ